MNTSLIENALELLEKEEYELAEAALRKILQRKPDCLPAKIGLGDMFFATSDYEAAEKTYKEVIENSRDNSDAFFGLAATLRVAERYPEAISFYEQAFKLEPDRTDAYWEIAYSKEMVGDLIGAEGDYQKCVLANPSNSMAQHLLAALRGDTTDRAPETYVSDLFDDYAAVFDKELIDELGYCVPQQIERQIKKILVGCKAKPTVLDIGCGTGLVGETLRCLVEAIDGVDLSPKMIEVARKKRIYTELFEADFESFLFNRDLGKKKYNMVVSGDALVYCGKLDKVSTGVFQRLDSDGVFCFSLEENSSPGYQLQRSGRYSHSSNYVNKTMKTCGFVPWVEKSIVPRTDGELDISGKLYLFKKH